MTILEEKEGCRLFYIVLLLPGLMDKCLYKHAYKGLRPLWIKAVYSDAKLYLQLTELDLYCVKDYNIHKKVV